MFNFFPKLKLKVAFMRFSIFFVLSLSHSSFNVHLWVVFLRVFHPTLSWSPNSLLLFMISLQHPSLKRGKRPQGHLLFLNWDSILFSLTALISTSLFMFSASAALCFFFNQLHRSIAWQLLYPLCLISVDLQLMGRVKWLTAYVSFQHSHTVVMLRCKQPKALPLGSMSMRFLYNLRLCVLILECVTLDLHVFILLTLSVRKL